MKCNMLKIIRFEEISCLSLTQLSMKIDQNISIRIEVAQLGIIFIFI